LARRRERLYAVDEQFRDTRPDDAVAEAARRPGLRIAEVKATVMEGYAGRPALGERAHDVLTDPETRQSRIRYLRRFETVTYQQLWTRAVADEWHHRDNHPVRSSDLVCVLGFASIDYTAIELALPGHSSVVARRPRRGGCTPSHCRC
jgi:fatty acid CoA ligase FadD9